MEYQYFFLFNNKQGEDNIKLSRLTVTELVEHYLSCPISCSIIYDIIHHHHPRLMSRERNPRKNHPLTTNDIWLL